MALIEKFHVVAAERAVAVGQLIKEGMIVSLNSSGEVVKQDVTNNIPYGIAGDTKKQALQCPVLISLMDGRTGFQTIMMKPKLLAK